MWDGGPRGLKECSIRTGSRYRPQERANVIITVIDFMFALNVCFHVLTFLSSRYFIQSFPPFYLAAAFCFHFLLFQELHLSYNPSLLAHFLCLSGAHPL